MKTLTLSSTNWFARYYNWLHDELPQDLCRFFWSMLYSIGLFFIVIPGRLMLSSASSYQKYDSIAQFFHGFYFWILFAICVVIGNGIFSAIGYEWTNLYGILILGSLLGAFSIALFFGAIAGIIALIIVTSENRTRITPIRVSSDFVGAIRRKHCTKITWK